MNWEKSWSLLWPSFDSCLWTREKSLIIFHRMPFSHCWKWRMRAGGQTKPSLFYRRSEHLSSWTVSQLFSFRHSVFSIPPKLLCTEKSKENVVCSLWLTIKLFTSFFHSIICLWIIVYWHGLWDLTICIYCFVVLIVSLYEFMTLILIEFSLCILLYFAI